MRLNRMKPIRNTILKDTYPTISKFRYSSNFTKTQARYLFNFFLLGALFSAIKYAEYKNKNSWQKIIMQSSDPFINSLKKKKCVVMLQSAKDDNGAFDFILPLIFNQLQELENHNIPFIFRKIHNCCEITDLFKKIKKNSNEITTLIIAGHGNPQSIEMGNDLLTASNLAFQMPKYIVLLACSAGKEENTFDISLARKVSLLNPNTIVISAKEDINSFNSSLEFDFIQEKTEFYPVPVIHFEKPFLSTLITIKNAFKDRFNEFYNSNENNPFQITSPLSVILNLQTYRNGANAFRNGVAIEIPIRKNYP